MKVNIIFEQKIKSIKITKSVTDLGVESMTHHKDEKKAEPKTEEAKVEPVHPSEQRGGKKKGLLDTCK